MSQQDDYVLGVNEEELNRLGLQHRVWHPDVFKVWAEAGITTGSNVVDLGCGPGFATFDLAEIVGPMGTVLGVERSQQYLGFARGESQRRGFKNTEFIEADLGDTITFPRQFDAAWCRWIACFLGDLRPLARNLAAAVRPGGVAIFHEYAHYATWRSIPESPGLNKFVEEVMINWRSSGGEPNIVYDLLPALKSAGFEMEQTRPLIYAVRPDDFMWRWPLLFVQSHTRRLLEMGRVSKEWAREVTEGFAKLTNSPDSVILTPLVLQIVARKS